MLRPSTKNLLLLIALSALPMFGFQNCSRVQFGAMDDGLAAAKGSPTTTTNQVVDPTTGGTTDVVDSDDSDTNTDSDDSDDKDNTADNDTDTDTDDGDDDKDNTVDNDTDTDTDDSDDDKTNTVDNDTDTDDGDDADCKPSTVTNATKSSNSTQVTATENGEKKMLICHVPPGNPAARKTLSISVNGRDHGHPPGAHGGDYDGPCEEPESENETIDTCSL